MHSLLRMGRQALAAAALLYCLGLCALALLWLVGVQGRWWLTLAQIFALPLFAPLLLLGPAVYHAQRRWRRAVAALAALAFIGLFGARFMPPGPARAPGTPLRVATFNLHYALADPQLAAGIAAIRAQRADVVALQELSPPAADAIRRELLGDYPYQSLQPATSYVGLGLISRHPLEVLPPPPQLAAQLAQVHLATQRVTLINASLRAPEIKRRRLPLLRQVRVIRGYSISNRSRNLRQLLQAIDQTRGPLVVAGDLNLSDREADYMQLATRLRDAYRATSWGFGYTFPSRVQLGGLSLPLPLVRIDYIWSGGGVIPAAAQVACDSASDHCMVIAELRVGFN